MSGIIQGFIASFTNELKVGDPFEGGFYAGSYSITGSGPDTHMLIISPKSTGETTAQWQTSTTDTPGTSSLWDGLSNTNNMIDTAHPAAKFCADLVISGYSDWYMPSFGELQVLRNNVGPQTSIPNFTSGGPQSMGGWFISSTQNNNSTVYAILVDNNFQINGWGKLDAAGVRAVRKIPI